METGESVEPVEPVDPTESPAELDSIPAGTSIPTDSETPFSVSESTMDEEFKSLCLCVEFVGSHHVVSERCEGGRAAHAGIDVQQQVSEEGGVYKSVCSESVLWVSREKLSVQIAAMWPMRRDCGGRRRRSRNCLD